MVEQVGFHRQFLPVGHDLAPEGAVIETAFFDDGSEAVTRTPLLDYEAAAAADHAAAIEAAKVPA